MERFAKRFVMLVQSGAYVREMNHQAIHHQVHGIETIKAEVANQAVIPVTNQAVIQATNQATIAVIVHVPTLHGHDTVGIAVKTDTIVILLRPNRSTHRPNLIVIEVVIEAGHVLAMNIALSIVVAAAIAVVVATVVAIIVHVIIPQVHLKMNNPFRSQQLQRRRSSLQRRLQQSAHKKGHFPLAKLGQVNQKAF